MKKLFEEINNTFRENKFNYFVILLFLCIGVVFGICTVKYMSVSDKNDLINYFNIFMESTRNESIEYTNLFFSVASKISLIVIPIFILGFTFWGTPVILVIDFIKGFTLGYTFAFLINTLDNKGLLLAFVSIIPQNIIYVPCIILLSIISMKIANYKFKKKFLKINNQPELTNLQKNYVLLFFLLFFGIIIETFVCPSIIKLVV